MNKLTALIEAAKAATPGRWETDQVEHDCPHQDIRIRAVGGGIKRTVCTVWIDDACYDENAQQERNATLIALANPATILELCAMLEKAEWTLEAMVENCEEPPEANCSCHVAPPCNDCVDFSYLREVFSDSKEALAAIKQWKEQT